MMLKYFVLVFAITAPASAFLRLETVIDPVAKYFGFGSSHDTIKEPDAWLQPTVQPKNVLAPIPVILASTAPAAKSNCPIVAHQPSNFQGNTALVNEEFISAIDRINGYAKDANVHLHITASYRKNTDVLHGTIVPPAVKSNHLVGHAIDMNVVYSGGFCNSTCLGGVLLPAPVAMFIDKIRHDGGLRWGGDFAEKDVVHIDDALNIWDPNMWFIEYVQTQTFC